MDGSIFIVEDLLSDQSLLSLNSVLLSRNFPFYWHDDIDVNGRVEDPMNFGFSHEVYNCNKDSLSEFAPLFQDILNNVFDRMKLNFEKLLRIRVVMLTNVGKSHLNDPHIDLDEENMYTVVFYPHETDGDFYWYDGAVHNQITPKMNMAIVMKGKIPHHGSSPIVSPRRIVVNANFTVRQ